MDSGCILEAVATGLASVVAVEDGRRWNINKSVACL